MNSLCLIQLALFVVEKNIFIQNLTGDSPYNKCTENAPAHRLKCMSVCESNDITSSEKLSR